MTLRWIGCPAPLAASVSLRNGTATLSFVACTPSRRAREDARIRWPEGLRPAARTSGTARPIGELVDIMDVGVTCAYLATPYARRLTGQTLYVDGGVNIMG